MLFYGDMITGQKIVKVVIPLNNLYVTILQTLSLHSDSRHFIFIVLHISFFFIAQDTKIFSSYWLKKKRTYVARRGY